MTFRVEDGQGAQALDFNAQLARLLGRGVVSGGQVTAAPEGSYTIEIAATSVYLNGQTHDLSATTLDLATYIADEHPRKALLYVDTAGEYVIAPGEPEPPQPKEQFRWDCFRPAPPDLSATDAVPLAEIWLSPNDILLTDADIRDRRLEADLDVHTLTADTVDVQELIDGAGVSHTGELAGADAIQTDEEVREAINTDTDHGSTAPHNYFSGSHLDLTDLSADDHHPRYTDTEARDAVRGDVDAADLDGASGSAGQHIEYTGSDVVWSDPPNQQAQAIASGTVTHTGGSATTVLLAGITTNETASFEIAVGVDADPTWTGDYGYSVDISRRWDDTNAQVDVELTLSWDTDPGSGNDLSLAWTAYQTSPVVVEGRYTDADTLTAIDGASLSPAAVDVSTQFNGPVYDDISTITGMEQGDLAVASGDGPSSFGQYLYDGADWVGPLGTSVSALSELTIDVDKDWQGQPISNVGAPTSATDAARQQEIDDHAAVSDAHHAKTTSSEIDHAQLQNVQSDQHHARYTDAEAVEATVGRVFTSSLTAAMVPAGEELQNWHYIPDGKTLNLVRAELMDANGELPDEVYLQLKNEDAPRTEYFHGSYGGNVDRGSLDSPLVSLDGPMHISVEIYNYSDYDHALSGSMSFEIS